MVRFKRIVFDDFWKERTGKSGFGRWKISEIEKGGRVRKERRLGILEREARSLDSSSRISERAGFGEVKRWNFCEGIVKYLRRRK
jgi:hypothetical protein